ncbi:MAG TPA: nicotinate-nucleotide adenylyltransferase [Verrucomicrobiae bacterium]|nr:nicotinate-nucleotide adenylyltransferase [Verrucomicrobiae bacterium]
MRIGILGGTFDPIHLGHLAAAEAAIDCARLDRVIFIPSGMPPHRHEAAANADQRLEMCRLAIDGNKKFEVSDVEVKRGGVSYTVDTLRELKSRYPNDELFLILGWDAAKLFSSWNEPNEIRRLASMVVVTRPGTGPLTGTSDIVCERPTPDISGSALRRAIASGNRVTTLLPEAVAAYIARHGLYGDNRHVGG